MVRRFPRSPRAERASGIPLWVKLAGGLVAVVVALHFYLLHRINSFADGLVRAAEVVSNASHRGGYYTWDGNLGIRRLRFQSFDGSGLFAMSEAELDTPGWWWVLQFANPLQDRSKNLSRALTALGADTAPSSLLPATDKLYLRLRGIEVELNPLLPRGMPDISFASAAPFETAGCTNLRSFVPLNLQRDLGLAYSRTDLNIGYRVAGPDKVVAEVELDAVGSMSTRFEMDWRSSHPRQFLDNLNERPTAMRWVMNDQGFVSARNRWCAQQSDIDADEFQRRHITTVRRLLEVFGVRLSPDSEAIYSSFASKGGTLSIEIKPPANDKLFANYSASEKWTALDPQIWRNSYAKSALAVELVRARPLPKAYSGSVYDLLARQQDLADSDAEFSPFATIGAQFSQLSQSPQTNVQDPAKAPDPKPATSYNRPEAPKPMPVALDSASLIAVIGERVSIETIDGRSRIGMLAAVEPKVLTIQMHVSGGKASLNFSRERVRSVIVNPDGR